MKNWIYQKYWWWKIFLMFLSHLLIKNPLPGLYYFIIGNDERSMWHYKGIVEAYYWIIIHLTHKGKKIK